VKILCSIAKVSRSGYYHWLKHSDEPDVDHDDYLLIKETFDAGKRKLGFRSIKMKLFSEKKIIMNHKKIIRIMKKYQLFAKIRTTNPYKSIMKKSLEHRTCENKLNRKFKQNIPFKTLSTDITYLPFKHSFVYLSVTKDIASREILGWELAKHLEMSIVINTVEKMQRNLISTQDVIIHSDQGFHYTNPLYIEKLKELKMIQSMSRKGNCIDNAPIESFFGHFKDDVDFKDCKTFDELYLRIEEYMEYYNHNRQQWDLKKMTPIEYRNHLLECAG
jgi:transposase InsO family protein